MIDIHSHILPGLDDGPESMETAVAMAAMAARGGTTEIVATPHASPAYTYDPEVVEQKIAELQEASSIRIHRGCDLHLSLQNIQEALRDPARYAINGLRYVLVELPEFFHAPSMDEVFRRMRDAGMSPIITHPERHPLLQVQEEIVAGWVETGCYVQVTGQSLTGGFGRMARRSAERLLRSGLVDFIASDGHDVKRRPPVLDTVYRQVEAEYGDECAHRLLAANPGAAVRGEELHG
jgi:protein-tyrosine phosphatase